MAGKCKTRKTRGGQAGNQNAHKHGFYSAGLTLPEVSEFWNAVKLGGADPATAVLRIKLDAALRFDPGNRRVLREASCLLAGWYRSRYCLTDEENALFKKFIRSMLEAAGERSVNSAGTNRSRTAENQPEMPERIEAETPRRIHLSASEVKK